MLSDKNKQNFITLNNGKGFLSKNDPCFWRKLLSFEPHNYKAMYNLGLEIDKEAEDYLRKYNSTHEKRYLNLYKIKKQEAYSLFRKALRQGGYLIARDPMVRLESELALINAPPVPKTSSKKVLFIGSIVLLLLILGVNIVLFLTKQTAPADTKIINNTFAQIIPYQVKNEFPEQSPIGTYLTSVIEVPQGVNEQELTNIMLNTLKELYQQNLEKSIKVIASEKGANQEVGSLIWSDKGKSANVYIYPSASPQVDAWESTTVIRSALYQFIKHNGRMPKELTELTAPFPNNYLTALPKEPNSMKNNVVAQQDGTGGWVYTPNPIFNDDTLKLIVADSLKPNLKTAPKISFEPITIYIDKTNNKLVVISGARKIKTYLVALGKENLTISGTFFIAKKIMNPDKIVPQNRNVFGTRGMELSDPRFAIHGTDTPETVGENVSLGCIRLTNEDTEDLYSYTPLYTLVKIVDKGYSLMNDDNSEVESHDPLNNLYVRSDSQKEEDNARFYTWNL